MPNQEFYMSEHHRIIYECKDFDAIVKDHQDTYFGLKFPGGQRKIIRNASKKDVLAQTGSRSPYIEDPITTIQEAVDMLLDFRIPVVFALFISVYDTFMNYRIGITNTQFGTSKGGRKTNLQSAHVATIPTLEVRPIGSEGEWLQHLKFSSYDYQKNATISIPKVINDVDKMIDGRNNEKNKKLRSCLIDIITQCAQKEITPSEALVKYLEAYSRIVKECQENAECDKLKVLNFIKVKLETVIQSAKDPQFFDSLLGYNFGQENYMRMLVIKLRYKLYKTKETIQSKIFKTIKKYELAVTEELTNRKIKWDPKLIETALMTRFKDSTYGQLLSKIFCMSYCFVESNLKTYKKIKDIAGTGKMNVESNLKTYKKIKDIAGTGKMNKLCKELTPQLREIVKLEWSYLASILRALRDAKGLKQTEVVEMLKLKKNMISQSGISKLEDLSRAPSKAIYKTPPNQRRKPPTRELLIALAEIYGVDVGLFFTGCIAFNDINSLGLEPKKFYCSKIFMAVGQSKLPTQTDICEKYTALTGNERFENGLKVCQPHISKIKNNKITLYRNDAIILCEILKVPFEEDLIVEC